MNQEIRRKLDRIHRHPVDRWSDKSGHYIEQISYLIYLKLLDEEESNRELQTRLTGLKGGGNGKLLFPKQAERYRWTKWRFKSGTELRDFVRDEVFPYMASQINLDAEAGACPPRGGTYNLPLA